MLHPPPSSTLFPYTTLFRSRADLHPRGHGGGARGGVALAALDLHQAEPAGAERLDRKSTRLNSSHTVISYAVFCLKKKKKKETAIATKSEADEVKYKHPWPA